MPCPSSTIDALIKSVHTTIAVRRGIAPPKAQTRTPDRIPYVWGSALDFSATGNARRFFTSGWSEPEPEYCWTNGSVAELNLPVPPLEGTDLILTAQLSAHVSTRTTAQLARISVNGALTGQWLVRGPGLHHVIVFERHFAGRDRLQLQFELPRAFSPQAHGLSADPRVLGLAFRSLTLRPVNPSLPVLSAS
jgi:hypothetical protein